MSIKKIEQSDFQKSSNQLLLEKKLVFKTFHAMDSVIINVIDSSKRIIGSMKMILAENCFVNPHEVPATANKEDRSLEITKSLISLINTANRPKAGVVIHLQMHYKDVSSSNNLNFQNIRVLLKFKKMVANKLAKMRQIRYYDSALHPLSFNGKFLKSFNTVCTSFQPDLIPVSFIKSKGLSKDPETQTKNAEKSGSGNAKPKSIFNLTIPEQTEFILEGLTSSRHPVEIKLSYKPRVSRSMQNTNSSLMVKSQQESLSASNKTNSQADKNRVQVSKLWQNELLTIAEYNDGQRSYMSVKNSFKMDFYLSVEDFEPSSLEIEVNYGPKDDPLKTLRGHLDLGAIAQIINSNQVSFQDYKFYVFLSPNNQRITLIGSINQSAFINNSHGKTRLIIHRLVYLDKIEFMSNTLVNYLNRNLLLNRELVKSSNHSKHFEFNYKIRAKFGSQAQLSGLINYQGMPLENSYEQMIFYTEGIEDKIELEMLVTSETATEIREKLVEYDQKGNNNSKKEKTNIEDNMSKKQQLSKDSTQAREKIVLCKGLVNLADYNIKQGERFNFYAPFHKIQSESQNMLSSFLDRVNRENIYVLASIEHTPVNWIYFHIHINTLSNLTISLSDENDESEKNLKIGLKLVVLARDKTGKTQERTRYHSRIYSFEEYSEQDNLISFNNEFFNFMYEPENEKEDLMIYMELSLYDGSTPHIIATRAYPLNNFIQKPESCDRNLDVKLNMNYSQESPFVSQNKNTEAILQITLHPSKYLKNIFKEAKVQKKVIKDETQQFDFRTDGLVSIVQSLINSRISVIIVEALNEIHEYLIFTKSSDDTLQKQKLLCFKIFMVFYKVYINNPAVVLGALRNIFALLSMHDLVKSLNNDDVNEFMHELVELTLICLKESSPPIEDAVESSQKEEEKKANDGYKKEPQNEKIQDFSSSFDFRFSEVNYKGVEYIHLPDIRKSELTVENIDKLSDVVKNNFVFRDNTEMNDGSDPQKEAASFEFKNSTGIFLYVAKIVDALVYQNEANLIKFKGQLLLPFNQGMEKLMNYKIDLIGIFIRIVKNIYLTSEYLSELSLDGKELKDIFECLVSINPTKLVQANQLDGICSLLEITIKKIVAIEAEGDINKVLIIKTHFNFAIDLRTSVWLV